VTPDAFRRLALAMPEASEGAHMGHPDFRVCRRIFATLGYPDGDWGMVALTPEQQEGFVADHPDVFTPVKGGWGAKGATNVRLSAATAPVLRVALAAACRNAVEARSRGRARKPTSRSPSARRRPAGRKP
jgi:hypothetical protein